MAERGYETVSSQLLRRGKIFALRADDVRMPDGKVASREVTEHFGAVAVVAMDDDHNLLLVNQYRHPIGRRLWELPAGLLDVVDEAPHETAARELKEEAGMAADTWQVLVDLDTTPGFSDESVRVYLGSGLSDVERPEAQDEEADLTAQWCPIAEAVRRVFSGDIVNSIAAAGILAAHAVVEGFAQPRPVDAVWADRPAAFAARQDPQ